MPQVSKVTMKLVILPPGPWNPVLVRTKSHRLAPAIVSDTLGHTDGIKNASGQKKVKQKATFPGWKQPPQSQCVPTEGGV